MDRSATRALLVGVLVVLSALFVTGSKAMSDGVHLPEIHCKHYIYGTPLGTPTTNDLIIRDIYALSSNDSTKFADWVAYRLDIETVKGDAKTKRDWKADPWLTDEETLEPEDYKDAHKVLGTDRGHQASLASFKGTRYWDQTNSLSNITPQKSDLNQGPWRILEEKVREFVMGSGVVYVLTGPLYEKEMPKLPRADEEHTVSSGYWKIIVYQTDEKDPSTLQTAAFVFPQETPRKAKLSDRVVTINEVERRTGLDFLQKIPDHVEERLERKLNEQWATEHFDQIRITLQAFIFVFREEFCVYWRETHTASGDLKIEVLSLAEARWSFPNLCGFWYNSTAIWRESMTMVEIQGLERFQFRDLHPNVLIGTASDRYAGWIGQIYSKERYANRITRRTNTVGGKSFVEEVLPVDSVGEYFEHFRVLEIDYTFYRTLLDEAGKPTQNYHVLRKYRQYLGDGDHLILKVPQLICAQKLRRGGEYIENDAYLNAEIFTTQFYEPAVEVLGSTLSGFIFEQEYQRSKDRTPVNQMAESLDTFFEAIPGEKRYHIELRTEPYLSTPVFEVLEKHGVGQVLSHWTWLPRLLKQFAKSDRRFFNSGGECIVRLMTPIGLRYEEAYAQAHPFDKMVEGMLQPQMVAETAALMRTGVEQGVQMNIVINNRAGGNAPIIAQKVAARFLEAHQNTE